MQQLTFSDGSVLLRATEEDEGLRGFVHAVPLFPGVFLMFIDIASSTWPNIDLALSEPDTARERNAYLLNYAVSGSCKVILDNNSFVLQKQEDLSLSSHFAKDDYFYPEGHYQGLEFFVAPVAANRSAGASSGAPMQYWFGLDFASLFRKYELRGKTKLGTCPGVLRTSFSDLWMLYPFGEEPAPFSTETLAAMRTETLRIFQHLQFDRSPFTGARRPVFRTPQLRVTEEAAALVREDLQKDWTLDALSETLGVSDSSLKRYFQNIYGCSVAAFQRKARMERAAELLRSPDTRAMSVLDVALDVGYENQSKFAAAFKRTFGESPLEFKKNAIL